MISVRSVLLTSPNDATKTNTIATIRPIRLLPLLISKFVEYNLTAIVQWALCLRLDLYISMKYVAIKMKVQGLEEVHEVDKNLFEPCFTVPTTNAYWRQYCMWYRAY